jgi:hypothetical protein
MHFVSFFARRAMHDIFMDVASRRDASSIVQTVVQNSGGRSPAEHVELFLEAEERRKEEVREWASSSKTRRTSRVRRRRRRLRRRGGSGAT